jgi:hypothetical protein
MQAKAEAGTAPARIRRPDDPVSSKTSRGGLPPTWIGIEKRSVPPELVFVTFIGTATGPPSHTPGGKPPSGTDIGQLGAASAPASLASGESEPLSPPAWLEPPPLQCTRSGSSKQVGAKTRSRLTAAP